MRLNSIPTTATESLVDGAVLTQRADEFGVAVDGEAVDAGADTVMLGVEARFPFGLQQAGDREAVHPDALGLGFDAMNSNTFQDNPSTTRDGAVSYKFGSLAHTDPAVRARRAMSANSRTVRSSPSAPRPRSRRS